MADKIGDLFTKIASDILDNMEEHIKLRETHNLGQEKAFDQHERVLSNFKECFGLVRREPEYYQFMHDRTLKD